MQKFGSTRLTQILSVSSLMIAVVCVAVVVLCGSVCSVFVICIAFLFSICFSLIVLVPDVFVSAKMIFGKVGFLIGSDFFLADSISLPSRAAVLCNSSCAYGNYFIFSVFFFLFVGGSLVPSWVQKALSSRSDEPCQVCFDSFRLISFQLRWDKSSVESLCVRSVAHFLLFGGLSKGRELSFRRLFDCFCFSIERELTVF